MSVPALSETRVQDRVLAFTRDAILRQIHDTAFDDSPLLAAYLGRLQNAQFGPTRLNGRGKKMQTGGESVVVRHNLGKNTTAKRLSGPWDTVDTTPSDTVRGSRVNWKHYSGTMTFSDTDTLINTGDEALSSLIRFETENAVKSVADIAGDDFYSGSTADAVTGLQTLTGTGTLQGLNPTSYTTWFSRGLSARGTASGSVSFASGSFASQGLSDMRLCWNNASEGAMQPQATYTTWEVFSYYEAALQPQERFTNTTIADAGFTNLAFKSGPVFPDSKCPTGEFHMLNFDKTKVICLSGGDLSATDFVRATNQEARTSMVMLKCALVSMDRRFHNKATGVTA